MEDFAQKFFLDENNHKKLYEIQNDYSDHNYISNERYKDKKRNENMKGSVTVIKMVTIPAKL